MRDISNPKLLWLKGAMFLIIGVAAGVLLILEAASWRVAVLLALCVWAFCRAYYFAFYVIEKYADPSYKFSGLASFAKYLMRKGADRGSKESR